MSSWKISKAFPICLDEIVLVINTDQRARETEKFWSLMGRSERNKPRVNLLLYYR